MAAAIDCVDVIREAEYRLGVCVVVLQSDLHDYAIAFHFHVDRLVMQNCLTAVQVLDKLRDAAVVLEVGSLGLSSLGIGCAFIGKRDQQALIKKSELAQALRQGIEVVLARREDLFVRMEMDLGSALLGGSSFFQLAGRFALRVSLLPGKAVAPDFQIELITKCVHPGPTNALQTP